MPVCYLRSRTSKALCDCVGSARVKVGTLMLAHYLRGHNAKRGCRPKSASPDLRAGCTSCAQLRAGSRHPHRVAPWRHQHLADLAGLCCRALRGTDPGPAQVIRIDALWLATEPLDMRAGTDSALARVAAVFGAARPHQAFLFANRRTNCMKFWCTTASGCGWQRGA